GRGDNRTAYQLYRRALLLNYDYTDALETRRRIGNDSAEAEDYREMETNELEWSGERTYPAGYQPSSIDREVRKSYLIRARLIRAACFVVLGEKSKGLADVDSLLMVFPWVYPAYLDKASIFGALGNKDSSRYYLNAFLKVETDTSSREYRRARWLDSVMNAHP
ncbi:MAG: hypothetical protein HY851_09615, partial [candidate division Zixibacteria bacterium]|nr:hypothetical protein [candidate division Zixibacteria bacterium]